MTFDAERVAGGYYPRAETPMGQRTFRRKLYATREAAKAAAPEALRQWQEGTNRGAQHEHA